MRIQRFGHAGLEVTDLAAAEAFYRRTFGFEVVDRYPEDGEILLGVGRGDHLLLHSRAAEGPRAGAIHHVAFELVEGHRQLRDVRQFLERAGIGYEEEDHYGDAALYFRDPDGNLLEVYAAPGSTPRFADGAERVAAARRFLYAEARPLERALYEHGWERAPAERVLAALDAYRNADGGFGHALEPDVRSPASQPLHTLTALELLREAGIRAPELADGCCRFLAAVAREDAAVPALRPGAFDWPTAAHWQGDFAFEPSLSWTYGLAAQLHWHGASHPWFEAARDACLAALERPVAGDAHGLLYRFRFAATLLDGERRRRELKRLRQALDRAAFFVRDAPVAEYGLTPLHFAPAPDDPAAACFDAARLDAHVDDLLDAQQGDGGWPIRFEPPSDAARLEWRGRWTLEALGTLAAYGRLPLNAT
ncbi:MAG TPA: VOC family protein [Pseudomonadales bacterium]